MKIGLVGLGKMGFNLAQNLLDNKYEVSAFDLNADAVQSVKSLARKAQQA